MTNQQDSSTDSKQSELPPTSSSEQSIEHYTPMPHMDNNELEAQHDNNDNYNDNYNDNDNDGQMGEPISRQSTVLQRIQSRYSFFSSGINKQRNGLYISFLKVYLIIAIGCLGVFSIYWGSFYQRQSRLKNLKMLVVLEDQQLDNIPPIYGNQMRELLETSYAKLLGDWHIYNTTEFEEIAMKHNNTVEEEVIRQIHHQKFWSSIYVKQNTTIDIYNSLVNGQFFNVSNATYSYYETGRHLTSMPVIVSSVEEIQSIWLDNNLVMSEIIRLGNITLDNNEDTIKTITESLAFQFIDRIPLTSDVLIASLQIGLLYLVIVSFFSFNFFDGVHKSVAQVIKKPHFLLYRTISSIVSYFVISLMFGLVTLAFQVNFAVTFGKSGFLVYWMITFLTMWTVGLASELAALVIIPIYPPLLGFWLIFWVIINITPSFTPIALLPEFYRYGYAMPLHNAFEIYCVIFFNTYKGQIGRNIGIIFAWVVILTLLTPLALINFSKQMAKKAAKAAQAEQKEK